MRKEEPEKQATEVKKKLSTADLEDILHTMFGDVEGPPSGVLKGTVIKEHSEVVRSSYVRLLGCDRAGNYLGKEKEMRDAELIAIFNNAMVLDGDMLQSGDPSVLQRYKKEGFHVSRFTRETVRDLLDDGGYAFLVECLDGNSGIATPYGAHVGFPFTPDGQIRDRRYYTLSWETLMPDSILSDPSKIDPEKVWSIWRTTIVPRIEDVREQLEQIGIPVSSLLLGQQLQRNGAGPATKLVVGSAARELEKQIVQCNIGKLQRPHSLEDIVPNELSFSSNKRIFRETDYTRTKMTKISASDGNVVLRVLWKILVGTPEEVIENCVDNNKAGLPSRGWNVNDLIAVGRKLAEIIRQRVWSRKDVA